MAILDTALIPDIVDHKVPTAIYRLNYSLIYIHSGDAAYPSSQRASANNTPQHQKAGENISAPIRNSADGGAETFTGRRNRVISDYLH